MGKFKTKRSKKTKLEAVGPEIPEDLKNKWAAVEACATVHHLLQTGTFTHRFNTSLTASLAFMAKLHENSVADALLHPQAELIPELKAILEQEKAKADGEENEVGTDVCGSDEAGVRDGDEGSDAEGSGTPPEAV